MTHKRNIELEEMTSSIKRNVKAKGLEQGEMNYSVRPLMLEQGSEFTFTYKFLGNSSQQNIYIYSDDPDFEEYINNPKEKGIELLDSKLEGLELIFLEISERSVKVLAYDPESISCNNQLYEKIKETPTHIRKRTTNKEMAKKYIARMRKMIDSKK